VNTRSNLMLERRWDASTSLSPQLSRRWSAPTVILAVTNLADEENLLFHAIQQARRSTAKVLLVHVIHTESATSHLIDWTRFTEHRSTAESALASINRMARRLRWVGIACEPFLLRGSPLNEIPLVAAARNADRLLMSAACEKSRKDTASKTWAEELLPKISIPICTVGQCLPATPVNNGRTGHVTLALSLHSDAEMSLAFASRLAQEHRATLTVMHVFGNEENGEKEIERTPLAVASVLPADKLREAELMCPLEVAVRKGDPATEILKSGSCTNQDFIVLGPIGQPQPVRAGTSSIVHRVVSEALCPVIVLGQSLELSATC
jgi:nucleotide-binding universal stress UspA family protein